MGRIGVEQFFGIFLFGYEFQVKTEKITLNMITDIVWCGVWVRLKIEEPPEQFFLDFF